ncbi:MAG TPA: ABC transporter substrate-binding protein [Acidimicrobiales bacterium]
MPIARKVWSRALAAALVAAAACGGGSDRPGASGSEDRDPVAAADRDGELRYAISFSFNSLDPHRALGSGDALWMRPVYDRLLTIVEGDDGMELAPQLATSYEVADDGRSITFELREGVTFHDGTAFDAEAVRANIERAKGRESTVSSELDSVERVEVVDPAHVVLHLNTPDPSVPWALAQGSTGMMASPAAFDRDLAAHPVGTGPYRIVEATKDADAVYERFEDHWDPDAALVRRLTLSTTPDANARFNGVRSGEFDAAYMAAPHEMRSRSLTAEDYHWEQVLSPVSWALLLNTDLEPFDDVRVRRAVSMAIDRTAISEELLEGANPPSYQPFPEGYLGHDPGLDEDPYDPDAARDLIADAGAEGADVQIVQNLTPPGDSIAEVIQQQLGDIGLDVELVPLGATEARPAFREGRYHGAVSNNLAQAEPGLTLELAYFGVDNPGTPPEELVTLAGEARTHLLGSPERERAYQEISRYLVENPIHVPIVQFSTVNLCRPEVVGCENLHDLGRLDFRRVGVAAG